MFFLKEQKVKKYIFLFIIESLDTLPEAMFLNSEAWFHA